MLHSTVLALLISTSMPLGDLHLKEGVGSLFPEAPVLIVDGVGLYAAENPEAKRRPLLAWASLADREKDPNWRLSELELWVDKARAADTKMRLAFVLLAVDERAPRWGARDVVLTLRGLNVNVVELVRGPDGALTTVSARSTDEADPADSPVSAGLGVRGTAGSGGGLPKEAIQRVVNSAMGAIKTCYERALDAKPTLEGTVTTAWVIGASGAVTSVKIAKTTLNDPVVEGCILAALAPLVYPPPLGGGVVNVTYPFVFSSSASPSPDASPAPEQQQAPSRGACAFP